MLHWGRIKDRGRFSSLPTQLHIKTSAIRVGVACDVCCDGMNMPKALAQVLVLCGWIHEARNAWEKKLSLESWDFFRFALFPRTVDDGWVTELALVLGEARFGEALSP